MSQEHETPQEPLTPLQLIDEIASTEELMSKGEITPEKGAETILSFTALLQQTPKGQDDEVADYVRLLAKDPKIHLFLIDRIAQADNPHDPALKNPQQVKADLKLAQYLKLDEEEAVGDYLRLIQEEYEEGVGKSEAEVPTPVPPTVVGTPVRGVGEPEEGEEKPPGPQPVYPAEENTEGSSKAEGELLERKNTLVTQAISAFERMVEAVKSLRLPDQQFVEVIGDHLQHLRREVNNADPREPGYSNIGQVFEGISRSISARLTLIEDQAVGLGVQLESRYPEVQSLLGQLTSETNPVKAHGLVQQVMGVFIDASREFNGARESVKHLGDEMNRQAQENQAFAEHSYRRVASMLGEDLTDSLLNRYNISSRRLAKAVEESKRILSAKNKQVAEYISSDQATFKRLVEELLALQITSLQSTPPPQEDELKEDTTAQPKKLSPEDQESAFSGFLLKAMKEFKQGQRMNLEVGSDFVKELKGMRQVLDDENWKELVSSLIGLTNLPKNAALVDRAEFMDLLAQIS